MKIKFFFSYILLIIFLTSCSNKQEKITTIKETNLESQMIEVYNQAMTEFERGDVISVKTDDNFEIARGLSNYSNKQANQLKGKKSASFVSIVGFQGRAELIHADDLVMMKIKREYNEST